MIFEEVMAFRSLGDCWRMVGEARVKLEDHAQWPLSIRFIDHLGEARRVHAPNDKNQVKE